MQIDDYNFIGHGDVDRILTMDGWEFLDTQKLPKKILTGCYEVIHVRASKEVHTCNNVSRPDILKSALSHCGKYYYRRVDKNRSNDIGVRYIEGDGMI